MYKYQAMKRPFLIIALVSILCVNAQDTYLQCGTIIDVATGKTHSEKTIVVSSNKIKSIRNGYVEGTEDDKVIDLKTRP